MILIERMRKYLPSIGAPVSAAWIVVDRINQSKVRPNSARGQQTHQLTFSIIVRFDVFLNDSFFVLFLNQEQKSRSENAPNAISVKMNTFFLNFLCIIF